jgi:hypothetical protein
LEAIITTYRDRGIRKEGDSVDSQEGTRTPIFTIEISITASTRVKESLSTFDKIE